MVAGAQRRGRNVRWCVLLLVALLGAVASGCQLPSPGGVNSQSSKSADDEGEGWLFRRVIGRYTNAEQRPAEAASPATNPLR